MSVTELCIKYAKDGDRFAALLANFLVDLQPELVVETGYGVSTVFILAALDANKRGNLISVDPAPWFGERIEHPRSTLILNPSRVVLPSLFARVGAWDVFLHDSDHDVENMTYELEFGFACLKPGGWLFCDDVGWAGHDAWQKFVARHGLVPIQYGSTWAVEKPTGARRNDPADIWEAKAFAEGLAAAAKADCAARGIPTESAAFAKR